MFGLAVPKRVDQVPSELLSPRQTWADGAAFDRAIAKLAEMFNDNFAKYADLANDEILAGAPRVSASS